MLGAGSIRMVPLLEIGGAYDYDCLLPTAYCLLATGNS